MGTPPPPRCALREERPGYNPPGPLLPQFCILTISNTVSRPREDPVNQEPTIADAIGNIMTYLLAIAEIQDTLTSTKFLHAFKTTHRELALLLETEGLGKAHLRDIPS